MKIKNVFLSTVNTGSMITSNVINLSIVSEDNNDKSIYIEFNINNAKISSLDYCKDIMEKQFFPEKECCKQIDERLNTILIKDYPNVLFEEMKKYLLKLSNNGEYILHFWVDNPLDWVFFINLFFAFKDEAPIIPEYINPYPQDLNTIIQFLFKDKDQTIYIENLIPYPNNTYNSIIKSNYLKTVVNKIKSY